ATADLLYLVPVPVVRDAFFPPGDPPRPVDDATAEDASAIEALARTWLGDGEDEVVLRWWAQHPDAFRVGRDDAGRPVAFGVLLERAHLDPDLALADPVVRAWEAHLGTDPVPQGSKVLFGRSFVAPADQHGDADRGRAPMFIDTKRTYLELRPALRRIYTVTDDWRA
ncbi:hypothetical protein B7486_79130, partial [cyanobacterium TDX16]